MARKLCVCGRSKKLPFCDNSHQSEGWSCVEREDWCHLGFCASFRYQNLALKLASHFNGAVIGPGRSPVSVENLVILVDGTDLTVPTEVCTQIKAGRQIVVSLGVAAKLLSSNFPQAQILDLGAVEVLETFHHIRRFLESDSQGTEAPTKPTRLASCFLSHSVADEPLLLKAVEYLRKHFAADIFLCADSIEPGVNWHDTILESLKEKDVVVVALSQKLLSSVYCAFEAGVATGLGKPVRIISLDGSLPPQFLRHIQTSELPRLGRQKPWLDDEDLLVEQLLKVLTLSKQ